MHTTDYFSMTRTILKCSEGQSREKKGKNLYQKIQL